MQKLKFDAVLGALAQLDPWLLSLGLRTNSGRWQAAIKTLQRAKEANEASVRGDTMPKISNYVPGLFEAMEMHTIFEAFSVDQSPALKEKMRRALAGPFEPTKEEVKTSGSRNTMFELFLAADWKMRGLPVNIGEPDITLEIMGNRFLTECKRPFSENSVSSNIEESARQLKKHLDKAENTCARGLIAISLSRVITANNLMVFSGDEGGRKAVTDRLISEVAQHEKGWRIKHLMNLHPRIVAVMFHLAMPWDIGGESLIYMASEHFVPAGNKDTEGQLLLKHAFECARRL